MDFKQVFKKLTFQKILPPPPKMTNVNFCCLFFFEGFPKYIFTTWKLTPGDGGSPRYCGSVNQCGGGGGGVEVDGSGPSSKTMEYQGKGYGGGGGGALFSGDEIGLPGLVLLEISSG